MPRNLEIKARLRDERRIRAALAALGARALAVEHQTDRYYGLGEGGRVKLRVIRGRRAQLIRYTRPETSGVRTSDYEITPVCDPWTRRCVVPAGRPMVVVRKRREILLLDNVRIHLDAVDDLGRFLELEAVVDATHDEGCCAAAIATITAALGIGPEDLLRRSYADLLLERG